MRTHVLALLVDALSLVLRHPGAALLTFAGVEVGIEDGEVGTVAVKHLVGLHVGMVDGDVLVLLERDAVQTVGQSEHAVDDS